MKTHVIIGAAAAGIGAINTLIKLDPHARIICISDETESPYNKCFLADYLHKVKQEHELHILKKEVLEHPNLHLFLSTRVTVIDPQTKTISLSDDTTVPYDTLFIGTGSSPIIPHILGLQQADDCPELVERGVFTFHTLADANKIMAYAKDHGVTRVAIVGAGLSGLECADSLRAWGLEVTVIERGDRVLARQVDEAGSEFIAQCMRGIGVELLCDQTVEKVISAQGRVSSVLFSSGEVCQIEMLIVAAGLKPNGALAQKAGLAIQDGYIAVDEYMRTSDEFIYSAGDCVMVFDQITKHMVPSCTWPDAMQQGSIAAHNMSLRLSSGQPGVKKAYPGAFVITSSAFFGKTFVTAGEINNLNPEYTVRVTHGDDFYHKLVLQEGKLKGYVLIGNTSQASKLRRALLTGELIV